MSKIRGEAVLVSLHPSASPVWHNSCQKAVPFMAPDAIHHLDSCFPLKAGLVSRNWELWLLLILEMSKILCFCPWSLHFTQANKHGDLMGLKTTQSTPHTTYILYKTELSAPYLLSWEALIPLGSFWGLLGIFSGTGEFSLYFNESFISSLVFNEMQEL